MECISLCVERSIIGHFVPILTGYRILPSILSKRKDLSSEDNRPQEEK